MCEGGTNNFFLWLLYVAGACRLRVTSKYKKQFPTPGDAERHFFGMSFDEETATEFSVASTQTYQQASSAETQTYQPASSTEKSSQTTSLAKSLDPSQELQIIADMFKTYAAIHYGLIVPVDFLQLYLNASVHLKKCQRSDVVYHLVKGVAQMRPDGTDSRFPAKKMPMGLLEYMVKFFNSDNLKQVFL